MKMLKKNFDLTSYFITIINQFNESKKYFFVFINNCNHILIHSFIFAYRKMIINAFTLFNYRHTCFKWIKSIE